MSENRIIGRDYEQHILQNICGEDEARLVAVYGRRRVGKTYLVKYFFKEKFDFFFTGSFETPMKVQLSLFKTALEQYSGQTWATPKNWFDAFAQLREFLQGQGKKQIVVFLDELPWMDTPRSNFLSAFTYFWNTWGSTRDYAEKLRQRNSTFVHLTKTKDALHNVLVTTYGLTPNLHSDSIYAIVTMDNLFSELTK